MYDRFRYRIGTTACCPLASYKFASGVTLLRLVIDRKLIGIVVVTSLVSVTLTTLSAALPGQAWPSLVDSTANNNIFNTHIYKYANIHAYKYIFEWFAKCEFISEKCKGRSHSQYFVESNRYNFETCE